MKIENSLWLLMALGLFMSIFGCNNESSSSEALSDTDTTRAIDSDSLNPRIDSNSQPGSDTYTELTADTGSAVAIGIETDTLWDTSVDTATDTATDTYIVANPDTDSSQNISNKFRDAYGVSAGGGKATSKSYECRLTVGSVTSGDMYSANYAAKLHIGITK